MGSVVCATRGGAGSRATQLRAIELATQGDRPLEFVLVIDPYVFVDEDPGTREAVVAELKWIGRAILNLALLRAEAADIDADVVILEGDVQTEVERYLRERDVDVLLVGAPRKATEDDFGDDPVERFAESVTAATGVPVEIVYPESRELVYEDA
ncbi:MAG: universal stress protein [Anaerolineae bacterium]